MKSYAIIVAGGSGSRMNSEIPKQFLLLKGKPVLVYSIEAFLSAFKNIEIILVLPELHLGKGTEIVSAYFPQTNIKIVPGGNTRFHSVQNGLKLINELNSIVFVHDAVRCLVTEKLIKKCYQDALQFDCSVPAITSKDSIRIENENGNHAINRELIKIVQTPQTFKSSILLKAFEQEYNNAFTDEATVVEAMGSKVHLTEGEECNIKITKPIDLVIAEQLISSAI